MKSLTIPTPIRVENNRFLCVVLYINKRSFEVVLQEI